MQKEAAAGASTTAETGALTPSTSSSTEQAKPTLRSKFEHASRMTNTMSPTTLASSLCHELDLYIAESPLDRSLCPYVWWAANQQRLPRLAEVGRKMLSVPVTSVASERLFSKAGDLITKKHNLLAPSTADRVVLLMENM